MIRNKIIRRVLRNKRVVIAGSVVLFLVIIAMLAPHIAPYPYDKVDFGHIYQPPSKEYPFGTDYLGRDIFSRIIYGARVSLVVAFAGAAISFLIGTLWGMTAGYFKGTVDTLLMRIVDFLYAFPSMLFIILLMVVFKGGVMQISTTAFIRAINAIDNAMGGLLFIMIGIGAVSWVGIARLTRGLTLSISSEQYIEAARAIGNSPVRIILRHVFPNLFGPCVVYVTLQIPGYILTESFLSFIGLGVIPPTPSWGGMIAEGCRVLLVYPHAALFPAAALALTMIAFTFLGDGLRDVLDVSL
jgi:oligopeptide transport system permease protein